MGLEHFDIGVCIEPFFHRVDSITIALPAENCKNAAAIHALTSCLVHIMRKYINAVAGFKSTETCTGSTLSPERV